MLFEGAAQVDLNITLRWSVICVLFAGGFVVFTSCVADFVGVCVNLISVYVVTGFDY